MNHAMQRKASRPAAEPAEPNYPGEMDSLDTQLFIHTELKKGRRGTPSGLSSDGYSFGSCMASSMAISCFMSNSFLFGPSGIWAVNRSHCSSVNLSSTGMQPGSAGGAISSSIYGRRRCGIARGEAGCNHPSTVRGLSCSMAANSARVVRVAASHFNMRSLSMRRNNTQKLRIIQD